MEPLVSVIVISFVIESIWSTVKLVWENRKHPDWQRVAIILLSVAVCIVYGMDVIALVGITSTVPVVGMILTGILASRGANGINDLLTKIYQWRKKE